MRIVYIANAIGHISAPLCDNLYGVYKENFSFIETSELSEDRKKVGSGTNRSYVINAKNNEQEVIKLCNEADVVIFGDAPLKYIKKRIELNKLTLYYSERLFKKGYYRYFNPITMKHVRDRFIIPSKNSNFYLLCASSFAPLDFKRVGAFKGKMYKWGYQTTVIEKSIDELLANKPQDGLEFIWVGRLVKLKHCDHAIKVIAKLNDLGYPARMTVIGTGEEENNLKQLANKLKIQDKIKFLGRCPIDATRQLMDNANIFMFTSDFGEGWGVTLNECMNSGVACVASHAAGATYFLAKDGENALVYQSKNVNMLFSQVKKLIDDKKLREKIARKGYETIVLEWNPNNSYKRFIALIESLLNGKSFDLYSDGPCSKAEVIKHNWLKKRGK